MKKSSAYLKIIIWSTVAAVFTILMVLIAVFGNFFDGFSWTGDMGNTHTIKKTELDSANIKNITIDWTYGNVYVDAYDGDKIIIDERSNKSNKEDLFVISEDNGTLSLEHKHSISFYNLFDFGFRKVVKYIKIPTAKYDEITAKFTSGKLEMNRIEAKAFNLRMTSGKADISNVKTSDLNVNMTSGDADIEGFFEGINSRTTSGDLSIKSSVAPSSLMINVTSGRVEVSIPDNDGFILSESKTSGAFQTDFDLDDFNRYKNGGKEYSVKITSGLVRLSKN